MYFPSHLRKSRELVHRLPAPYLNGQGMGTLREFPFGLRKVDNNGCGPISVYNAMVHLGKQPDLPKILRFMELTAAPVFGLFGTFPYSMGYCLRKFGIKNRMTFSRKKLANAKSAVVAFWTKRPIFGGAHFVFFSRDEQNRFVVYNRYGNVSTEVTYDSINGFVKPWCLIVGYVIE